MSKLTTALVVASLVVLPAARAAQTLTPPPPPYESCDAVGGGTICQGTIDFAYGPVDAGLTCGSFAVLDTAAGTGLARRFYDANGDLVRRMRVDRASGQLSNAVTGNPVPYRSTLTNVDVLAVPGDLGSATETTTGEYIVRPSHGGPVFMDVGRTIVAPDGTLEFRAGPQDFFDLLAGDTSVLDPLCAALAP